ncbi:MAG TPA: VOC family protein [Propionicimonas sp.]|jgi:catechol 2,3-dioxygenase-like lactoylglutathione lyase family enzyme|uniref:VOC family protein n=1 Tax=Propionicimonas sp. TaxID=1955623 RepID=UPI002F41E20E
MTQPEWPDLAYRAVAGGPVTPTNTQLTVDCDDPHAQAAFWAAALGYLIEDGHDFVQAVVASGFADRERDTVEIDGRLAWRTGTGIKHPDDVDAARGTGRRILFVAVPDRAPGKNKWHLDLNVGRERIEAEVARLTALGATEQYRIDEPGAFHTTMADPEGNLFCVQ